MHSTPSAIEDCAAISPERGMLKHEPDARDASAGAASDVASSTRDEAVFLPSEHERRAALSLAWRLPRFEALVQGSNSAVRAALEAAVFGAATFPDQTEIRAACMAVFPQDSSGSVGLVGDVIRLAHLCEAMVRAGATGRCGSWSY